MQNENAVTIAFWKPNTISACSLDLYFSDFVGVAAVGTNAHTVYFLSSHSAETLPNISKMSQDKYICAPAA